jgi:hypothetical protein
MFFNLAIIFLPGMIAGFIVYEREDEIKHQ